MSMRDAGEPFMNEWDVLAPIVDEILDAQR
jgi:hypothetical protein